ncbi:MAG TPA: YihY/virulence factor BrkB family protein [Steroidobacter sp.]|nr:YihY/virulence factor BrkB family protein [Steroidobacter sp.]
MPRAMPADRLIRGHDAERGRNAREPQQIPPQGWWDIVLRVKDQLNADNASIIAAGLALYALLAIFPALTAVVLLYGLFASPEQITVQLQGFQGLLPAEGMVILQRQLTTLASQQGQTLGIGLITAVAIALWSARKGTVAVMAAMNIAYDEREKRGFFRQLFVSLAFTVGMVLGFAVVIALGVAVPVILNFLPLGDATEVVLLVLRWALLWLIAALGLTIVYRYAPSRTDAKWTWVSWGSTIAATLWLIGSLLFAFYVRRFGATYGETYGALGGVVIMLLWLYLSAFVLILGAEINSEMERQTKRDTTIGPEKPMGERGAYSADTLGPARGAKAEDRTADRSA